MVKPTGPYGRRRSALPSRRLITLGETYGMTAVVPDIGQDRPRHCSGSWVPFEAPTSHEGGYNGRRRVRTASKGGGASRRRSAGRQAAAQAGSGERRGQAAGRGGSARAAGRRGERGGGTPQLCPVGQGAWCPSSQVIRHIVRRFPSRGTAFHRHGLDVQRVTAGNARSPGEGEARG